MKSQRVPFSICFDYIKIYLERGVLLSIPSPMGKWGDGDPEKDRTDSSQAERHGSESSLGQKIRTETLS